MQIDYILYYTCVSLVFIAIFTIFRKQISKHINLIDLPNADKIHDRSTPLTGSFAIFFLYIFILINEKIFNNDLTLDELIILIITTVSFVVGLVDDKINISYKKKFIILIPLIYLPILFSENLIIYTYNFQSFEKIFIINNVYFASFLTTLFILLLINSINLIDGINGLALGIIIIWFGYLVFFLDSTLINVYFPILICALITFFFIYHGFYFLGDSGSLFLPSLIGLLIINSYNVNISLIRPIFIEEIFILFMLPGFDMLRVFLIRLAKKTNPFKRSKDHLHYHLIKKYSLFKVLLINFSYIVLFICIYNLNLINSFMLIILGILVYLFIVMISQKN